jgi:hypothetical protein
MRQIVRGALAPSAGAASSTSAPTSSSSAAPSTDAAGPAAAPDPVADVSDACRYDPARAQQALAAGEPPTKKR